MNIGRTMTLTTNGHEFHGTVIDETRNTITLTTSRGRKMLIKQQIEGNA